MGYVTDAFRSSRNFQRATLITKPEQQQHGRVFTGIFEVAPGWFKYPVYSPRGVVDRFENPNVNAQLRHGPATQTAPGAGSPDRR
jgi:hypothetical protein